jgi:hypothetical protein
MAAWLRLMTNEYPRDRLSARMFWSSRSKLKTFEDLTKKTKLKCRSGDVVEAHINPELVFRRALVLASSREDVDFAIVAPLSNALVSEASISFGACITTSGGRDNISRI